MTTKTIPFNFVLDYLYPLPVAIKPMFGATAIYIYDKIVLALRERPKKPDSNGIWIATSKEHHNSLRKELPSITSIPVLGHNTGWRLRSPAHDDFEELAIKLCELIKANHQRIGKIPNPKKKHS